MSAVVNGNGTSEHKGEIRLCHIIKWPDYDGYGFNLHAEKSKPGQFIGKIDEGSPAEAAGLKEGDRIIEVNGANIAGEDHKSVVSRIKEVADETKLLVVDKENSEYFNTKNITITSSLPEVVFLKTPSRSSSTPVIIDTNGKSSPIVERKTSSSISSESPKSQKSSTSSGSKEEHRNGGKLNLNMSATEFRNQLKKKYDPKKENMDVKKKYEIIDQL